MLKKIWKEHCSNPDSNVALELFQQIINKLLDKDAPYVMSKFCSSFRSKPWITMAIVNSLKSKNKFYKKFCKKKPCNRGKFIESSSKLIGTILRRY